MRMVLWSAWDLEPVYDGDIRGAVEVWRRYVEIEKGEDRDEETLREAKISYLQRFRS